MKKIIISRPDFFENEAARINELFEKGMQLLHLRKPDCSKEALAGLLGDINPAYYPQIALHQYHELAQELCIKRLHFPEKHRLEQTEESLQNLKAQGFVLSTSIHNPAALADLTNAFSYTFLGPVFDSISKQNYRAALPENFKLARLDFTGEVIAIGGIDDFKIQTIAQMGFNGAAFLGSIWPKFEMLDQIERFQFISQENEQISHIESIQLALEAGCRWVQLRVKNKLEEEVLPLAWEAIRLCDQYGARLIINDFPKVALAVEAYGLHLGLTDMSVPEARALVGDKLVIGGTANTWEDIVLRAQEGADYIGLGPFRFTTTKQNLSPELGLQGYRNLVEKMAAARYTTPLIGIGGITPADVAELKQTGLYGVAMSSSLINAADRRETFNQIQKSLC